MRVFKNLFLNENNRNLFRNFFYLSALNVANFILPFLTFPYLVRVIGIDNFGLLAFATSIATYFIIITDYGFNLTATRHISINRGDSLMINKIVSSVFIIKAMLFAVSLVVFVFLIMLIPKLYQNWQIFLFTFGTVAGQFLFPVWFFQGIEKMKVISILNVLSKVIFTVAIFVFVRDAQDFYLVPIFSSLGYLLSGIISIYILINNYKVKLEIQKIMVLKYYLKDGWHIFISNISVTLYTTVTVSFLGFITNNTIVGYYTIAEKIISAFRGIMSPLSQAFFPFLSKKSLKFRDEVLLINRKLLIYGTAPFISISLGIFFFADKIILLLFNISNQETINTLKILSPVPFLIFLATIYALFTMIVFGKNREYSRIIISGGFLNLFIMVVLVPLYHHIGAAICVVTVELFVTFKYIKYTRTNQLIIL